MTSARRRQYQLLVGLFKTLSARQELTGQLGLDRHATNVLSIWLWLVGAAVGLLAFGPMTLRGYDLAVLNITSLVLFLVVVMEAASTFLNPAEVTVLAHQPIDGSTYVAAKMTHIVAVVTRAVVALNVLPAFAGLLKSDARWFYPLAHLTAAYFSGLFVALVSCGIVGMLVRWVPAARLRQAALWLQLVPILLPHALASSRWRLAGIDGSLSPLVWFHRLALAGHDGPPFAPAWPAAVGLAACGWVIVYGVRSLSRDYLTRIFAALRTTRPARRRHSRSLWFARASRALAGSASGHAAFAFVSRMMLRDWHFRRMMLNGVLVWIVFGGFVSRTGAGSPFATGAPTALGVLPEFLGLFTLFACMALPHTEQYRGRWIFQTAPLEHPRPFARGVFLSLWVPFVGLPLGAALPILATIWGAADAALFAGYALAVSTCLLNAQLLLAKGLPFSHQPTANQATAMAPFVLFGPVAIGIGFLLQRVLIFQSRLATTGVTLAFLGGAIVAGRYAMRRLEAGISDDLAAGENAAREVQRA